MPRSFDPQSSTKNANKARDPEIHQTRKGKQWYFVMKAHFGVDSRTKLIYAVVAIQPMSAIARYCPIYYWQETGYGVIRPTAVSGR
jgi:hypothetical protein